MIPLSQNWSIIITAVSFWRSFWRSVIQYTKNTLKWLSKGFCLTLLNIKYYLMRYFVFVLVMSNVIIIRLYKIVPWSSRFLLQHHQTNKKLMLFLKYTMPRCENPRNSRILHFCVLNMDLWSKFSKFNHLQKINEGTEWLVQNFHQSCVLASWIQ